MRRMENDLLFFHELIGNCSVEKDSKIYTISPKFGKGTMQSFEVMPGAEIVYSNVHITTPIQKNIQCIDRFIEVTYCFHGRVNMLFSDQPEMIMSDHYISVFNGASHLKSCDFGEEPFVGVSVVAYLPQIINSLNIMLGTIAFDEDMDFQGLFTAGGCFIAPATKSVEHIFTELLLLPEQYRNYLMRIKVMELLLYLVGKMEYRTDFGISLFRNNLPTENEKQGTTQFADTQADVRFENVSFSYDGKRDAVSHVSFSAKPGTITALVGPSGSGKSTLLNLIPGFVTPKNGRILLNWKDAATLKHSDLVRHVSVVFQEVYLFQDTMMNNIRMGNQSATDEQVVEAAKKAHCHEFIEKLPQGYQTVISEGGASLSGGERQRVAIARAILKDSPIILLDEALSSLDAENAVAIQKGIEEMIKGKTVFLVSHTLSYIQNSDQILVLSDGILQGCGKHEELLQTVPLYQTMWEKEKSIKNWKLA